MYYSRKVLDPNEDRRRPFRHVFQVLLPVIGVAILFITIFNIDGLAENYDNEAYYGYVVVDTYSSRSQSHSLFNGTKVEYSQYLELMDPSTGRQVTVEIPTKWVPFYDVGQVYEGEYGVGYVE